MLLNVAERIVLLQLLPVEGDVITLRVVREARGLIGLTEFELKRFEVVQDNGSVRWSNATPNGAEVEIGAAVAGIVSVELQKLNTARKLTENHLSLYEKFCERAREDKPAPPLEPEKAVKGK